MVNFIESSRYLADVRRDRQQFQCQYHRIQSQFQVHSAIDYLVRTSQCRSLVRRVLHLVRSALKSFVSHCNYLASIHFANRVSNELPMIGGVDVRYSFL